MLRILIIFGLLFSVAQAQSLNEKMELARSGFESRWEEFSEGRTFPLWHKDEEASILEARFEEIKKGRWSVYFVNPQDFGKGIGRYKERYATPSRDGWHSRYPLPLTFQYNLAVPGYDASIIWLGGRAFLAAEAPSEENVDLFFKLLDKYRVTHLVRLAPVHTGIRESCFAYWEDRMTIHSEDGRAALDVLGRDIHYYFTDRWEDHKGHDVQKLLALLNAIRQPDDKEKMIAVHCRAGVGRTAVLIAGLALLEEVDNQLAKGVPVDGLQLSVDKVVWQLSLQRPFTIAYFSQYEMLYRILDLYGENVK